MIKRKYQSRKPGKSPEQVKANRVISGPIFPVKEENHDDIHAITQDMVATQLDINRVLRYGHSLGYRTFVKAADWVKSLFGYKTNYASALALLNHQQKNAEMFVKVEKLIIDDLLPHLEEFKGEINSSVDEYRNALKSRGKDGQKSSSAISSSYEEGIEKLKVLNPRDPEYLCTIKGVIDAKFTMMKSGHEKNMADIEDKLYPLRTETLVDGAVIIITNCYRAKETVFAAEQYLKMIKDATITWGLATSFQEAVNTTRSSLVQLSQLAQTLNEHYQTQFWEEDGKRRLGVDYDGMQALHTGLRRLVDRSLPDARHEHAG
jgi:hypothetical protein